MLAFCLWDRILCKHSHKEYVIFNNKILRILHNALRDTNTVELYTKFNTFPIPALHNCQLLKLVHKFTYHRDKLPAIFANYFTTNYVRAGFRGGGMGPRAPGLPPKGGLPPNPSIFISLSL